MKPERSTIDCFERRIRSVMDTPKMSATSCSSSMLNGLLPMTLLRSVVTGIPDLWERALTVICLRAISALTSEEMSSERGFSSFGILLTVVHLAYSVKSI